MPDGSIRWVVVTGRVEGGTDGRSAPAMFGTAADITDYKRSQQLLRSNEERQAFLLTLSDTLRSLTDPVAIAAAASRLLGEQLGASRVYGGEVIDDMVLVQGDYAASGRPMEGQLRLSSLGQPVVETYRRGARLVVADVHVHPAFQGEDLSGYEAAGAVGAIVIPMRRSDSLGALFVVTSPVPRAWSDAEVELADEVAQRAWAATDGLRREEALRESETRFRLLVENITDYAIYRTNARGVITDWTEGAARVKGYAAHEVIGRHVSMFHTPDDVASGTVERVLEEAARSGRSEHETWKVRAGGERFWANEITTALHDATGKLVGFTRISRDLTAQRRIEAEREELLERERTRREAAEAFMAVMSHELKTPVTSIYSAASLLRKSPGRPDLTELVDDIEEEADRLLRIVDDLLVLSGVERGVILLAPEPILVHHTLAEVLGTVERRFPDVDFEVERSGPTADRARGCHRPPPGHQQPADERGEVRRSRRPGPCRDLGHGRVRRRLGPRPRPRPRPGPGRAFHALPSGAAYGQAFVGDRHRPLCRTPARRCAGRDHRRGATTRRRLALLVRAAGRPGRRDRVRPGRPGVP